MLLIYVVSKSLSLEIEVTKNYTDFGSIQHVKLVGNANVLKFAYYKNKITQEKLIILNF